MSKTENQLRLENDTLRERIRELEGQDKLGLFYPNYPEAVLTSCENHIALLQECVDKAIVGSPDGINHTLIEGDNYAALLALQYGYENKVGMIYIDPPFNKGEDFRYNDDRIDRTHPFRSGMWCNFMERRLRLARKLLSNDGVIFISIDDDEMDHLRGVCDKVFLRKNFIAAFPWRCRRGGGFTNTKISVDHEYVLLYAKNAEQVALNDKPKDTSKFEKKYPYKDEKGCYKRQGFRKTGTENAATDRPTMAYDVEAPDGTIIKPMRSDGSLGRWRSNKDGYLRLLEQDELVFRKVKGKWQVYQKERPFHEDGSVKTEKWQSLLYDVAANTEGTNALKEVFAGEKLFDFPKPPSLIRHLLRMASRPDSIILDFFAGSGTTAESVLALNAEDGGSRRVILCTNNEQDICQSVTYPRFKSVVAKHKPTDSLRYYTLNFMPYSLPHGLDEEKVAIYKQSVDTVKDATQCFCPQEAADGCVSFSGKNGLVVLSADVYNLLLAADVAHEGTVAAYSFSADAVQRFDSQSFPLPMTLIESQR